MPNAIAPNAPCVRGVRVAADDRHARLGQPELRADDVHDALLDVAERVQADAELLGVACAASRPGCGDTGSAIGLSQSRVGTLWSSVARVRSGRRTARPASRRPSKACGEVTSWMRWRSM